MGVLAADIAVGGPLPTDTKITVTGNITNISTGTTVGNGTIGINSFGKFNVANGDIVNLNLINSQNKLVNLIFQDSASQINGIVNSYMNKKIGGNVLFANPNGFVIGSNGVFNVGSLTLITPKEDTMKDLIDYGVFQNDVYDETKIERLVSFTFNDQDYLVNGNKFNPIELAASPIEIAGTINSKGGIDLISGSEVNLQSTSKLNANMEFTVEGNSITATPNSITSATTANYPKNLAMQNGKNIVIVASNNEASSDVLSAIVNLKGTVSANGGDVIARTEVFQTDKEAGDAKSEINVTGTIKGGNILIDAVSKIADFDNNIVGISQSAYDNYFGYIGDLLNWVAEDFAHLAKVDTSVNIENNAVIAATNDVVIGALSDMTGMSIGIIDSMSPNVNVNVTYIDANTNAIVKEGSLITAKNLKVNATTDLSLTTTTKSTDIFDNKLGKDPGSYAVNVTNTDIDNNAIIENGATLGITEDIDVIAKTTSFHSDLTKNGVIPVLESNKGVLGGAISVIIKDVNNNAIMNANADISGELNVLADYSGNISSSLSAVSSGTGTSISGGTGEDSKIDQIFQYFRKRENIKKVVTRANAKYKNFDSAAAVGIAVDEVVSTAQIGDLTKSIKPKITADRISVQANALDDKSCVYASAESEKAGKTASGAFALNYKDIDANATAYGDFTLNGSTTTEDALSINATTTINQPMAWIDWWASFTLLLNFWEN